MSDKEKNAYILGTENEELHRLGLQHQVWDAEARSGWKSAGFTAGHKILDLGCGPGFCTRDLAFMVGPEGKVTGVDKSQAFIDFLDAEAKLHGLSIDAVCSDFNDMDFPADYFDGIYCRWAMAWIPNVVEIVKKLHSCLKVGGKLVFQEYYDWSTLQTEPYMPALDKCIKASLQSFKNSPGNIDIGRRLPAIMGDLGMKVDVMRPMTKLARPHDLEWQWPKTFFHIYFSKVAEMGLISQSDVKEGLKEFIALEKISGATIHCPLMVEVIGSKQ